MIHYNNIFWKILGKDKKILFFPNFQCISLVKAQNMHIFDMVMKWNFTLFSKTKHFIANPPHEDSDMTISKRKLA